MSERNGMQGHVTRYDSVAFRDKLTIRGAHDEYSAACVRIGRGAVPSDSCRAAGKGVVEHKT